MAIYIDQQQAKEAAQNPAAARMRRHDFGIDMKASSVGSALNGALVTKVAPHSRADEAGIMEGDILLRIGDANINNPDDVQPAVAAIAEDSRVTIKLTRKGAPIWVSAQF